MKCTNTRQRQKDREEEKEKKEQFNLILAAYYHWNNLSVWGFVTIENLFLFFDWSFLFDTIIDVYSFRERIFHFRNKNKRKKKKKRFSIGSNKVLAFNTFSFNVFFDGSRLNKKKTRRLNWIQCSNSSSRTSGRETWLNAWFYR